LAALLPARAGYGALLACVTVAAAVGGAAVLVIRALGPGDIPTFARSHLFGVMLATVLPVLALVGVAVVAYVLLARLAPERPMLQGAAPLLITALVMGFSLPNVVTLLATPIDAPPVAGEPIPGDGIAAARWLRDHSDSSDLVATNLHLCRAAAGVGDLRRATLLGLWLRRASRTCGGLGIHDPSDRLRRRARRE